MTTTEQAVGATGLATTAVHRPSGGLSHQARAAKVVWERELIRFWRDRGRILSSFAQPLLFLFVLGSGLSRAVQGSGSFDFKTFLFPGVLGTSVLFTAAFAGISMVWDREFGFLREMLVAPVSSAAILTGKCLGGATVATLQALVVVALAGVVHVPYDPVMIVGLVGMLFVTAFTITAVGLVLAARAKSVQAAMPLVQLTIAPMMFTSGALFPLSSLPTWLEVVTRLNPLTYAVEPMRALVFRSLSLPPGVRHRVDPGITWFGHTLSPWTDVLVVVVIGLALLGVSVARFSRVE